MVDIPLGCTQEAQSSTALPERLFLTLTWLYVTSQRSSATGALSSVVEYLIATYRIKCDTGDANALTSNTRRCSQGVAGSNPAGPFERPIGPIGHASHAWLSLCCEKVMIEISYVLRTYLQNGDDSPVRPPARRLARSLGRLHPPCIHAVRGRLHVA